ncbi:conserved hypothetical protein [Neospora caninum Liverpool]|uniref:DNA-directed RNA polymerase II subunit RPB1 n=1 Tax=Neospora caninum (strain Liverpool) TaxID=572307 RepID=F0VL74_NEOCL|nr:conserved hypothetical protein [Neospora caninum Liverpool]CBZ54826.1 conserved hypothetical protein [Neospora caninum Liverpool]CEL69545.1 TPA: DNA-directed RNA polymerase II subunit RPB1 [Neospora caninum Liverpool]|eukprot:XP_003884854.1 conserved hypothetical protein [Neospora caninum Liverpool]
MDRVPASSSPGCDGSDAGTSLSDSPFSAPRSPALLAACARESPTAASGVSTLPRGDVYLLPLAQPPPLWSPPSCPLPVNHVVASSSLSSSPLPPSLSSASSPSSSFPPSAPLSDESLPSRAAALAPARPCLCAPQLSLVSLLEAQEPGACGRRLLECLTLNDLARLRGVCRQLKSLVEKRESLSVCGAVVLKRRWWSSWSSTAGSASKLACLPFWRGVIASHADLRDVVCHMEGAQAMSDVKAVSELIFRNSRSLRNCEIHTDPFPDPMHRGGPSSSSAFRLLPSPPAGEEGLEAFFFPRLERLVLSGTWSVYWLVALTAPHTAHAQAPRLSACTTLELVVSDPAVALNFGCGEKKDSSTSSGAHFGVPASAFARQRTSLHHGGPNPREGVPGQLRSPEGNPHAVGVCEASAGADRLPGGAARMRFPGGHTVEASRTEGGHRVPGLGAESACSALPGQEGGDPRGEGRREIAERRQDRTTFVSQWQGHPSPGPYHAGLPPSMAARDQADAPAFSSFPASCPSFSSSSPSASSSFSSFSPSSPSSSSSFSSSSPSASSSFSSSSPSFAASSSPSLSSSSPGASAPSSLGSSIPHIVVSPSQPFDWLLYADSIFAALPNLERLVLDVRGGGSALLLPPSHPLAADDSPVAALLGTLQHPAGSDPSPHQALESGGRISRAVTSPSSLSPSVSPSLSPSLPSLSSLPSLQSLSSLPSCPSPPCPSLGRGSEAHGSPRGASHPATPRGDSPRQSRVRDGDASVSFFSTQPGACTRNACSGGGQLGVAILWWRLVLRRCRNLHEVVVAADDADLFYAFEVARNLETQAHQDALNSQKTNEEDRKDRDGDTGEAREEGEWKRRRPMERRGEGGDCAASRGDDRAENKTVETRGETVETRGETRGGTRGETVGTRGEIGTAAVEISGAAPAGIGGAGIVVERAGIVVERAGSRLRRREGEREETPGAASESDGLAPPGDAQVSSVLGISLATADKVEALRKRRRSWVDSAESGTETEASRLADRRCLALARVTAVGPGAGFSSLSSVCCLLDDEALVSNCLLDVAESAHATERVSFDFACGIRLSARLLGVDTLAEMVQKLLLLSSGRAGDAAETGRSLEASGERSAAGGGGSREASDETQRFFLPIFLSSDGGEASLDGADEETDLCTIRNGLFPRRSWVRRLALDSCSYTVTVANHPGQERCSRVYLHWLCRPHAIRKQESCHVSKSQVASSAHSLPFHASSEGRARRRPEEHVPADSQLSSAASLPERSRAHSPLPALSRPLPHALSAPSPRPLSSLSCSSSSGCHSLSSEFSLLLPSVQFLAPGGRRARAAVQAELLPVLRLLVSSPELQAGAQAARSAERGERACGAKPDGDARPGPVKSETEDPSNSVAESWNGFDSGAPRGAEDSAWSEKRAEERLRGASPVHPQSEAAQEVARLSLLNGADYDHAVSLLNSASGPPSVFSRAVPSPSSCDASSVLSSFLSRADSTSHPAFSHASSLSHSSSSSSASFSSSSLSRSLLPLGFVLGACPAGGCFTRPWDVEREALVLICLDAVLRESWRGVEIYFRLSPLDGALECRGRNLLRCLTRLRMQGPVSPAQRRQTETETLSNHEAWATPKTPNLLETETGSHLDGNRESSKLAMQAESEGSHKVPSGERQDTAARAAQDRTLDVSRFDHWRCLSFSDSSSLLPSATVLGPQASAPHLVPPSLLLLRIAIGPEVPGENVIGGERREERRFRDDLLAFLGAYSDSLRFVEVEATHHRLREEDPRLVALHWPLALQRAHAALLDAGFRVRGVFKGATPRDFIRLYERAE